MTDIIIRHATALDIAGIIRLATRYYVEFLSTIEQQQGFLGKIYTDNELRPIIGKNALVIAQKNDEIIAFYLVGDRCDNSASLYQRNRTLPIFDSDGTPLDDVAYPTQVCIDSHFRGGDLFKQMLHMLAKSLSERYCELYCSIASNNIVSLRAHQKAGWQFVNEFEGRQFFCFVLTNKSKKARAN